MKMNDIQLHHRIPEYNSQGLNYYVWGHAYSRRIPKVSEFMIKKPEFPVEQLFDKMQEDGQPFRVVFVFSEETKPRTTYSRKKGIQTKNGGELRSKYVYDVSDTIRVCISGFEKAFSVFMIGELEDDLDAHADWLREHFPKQEDDENEVPFQFVYAGDYGADSHDRNIVASRWADIRDNYAIKVQPQLDALVNFTPDDSVAGKIGILHGPPGTGKTHLIRALSLQWKEWAEFKYVLDVERFFTEPSYMLDVVLKTNDENKWNVVLCEDAEEYIAPDSKEKIGQALARLLNIGDGLIGQGLRLLMLFTTNAPDTRMHDAIMRPGRCFTRVHVPLLTKDESNKWLLDKRGDLTDAVHEAQSLAQLYAKISEEPAQIIAEEERKIGFGQYV